MFFLGHRTDPGPYSTTLPREMVPVWDQLSHISVISVAPEEKKNVKRILKQHLCFFCFLFQETLEKGSVKG